MANFLDTAIPIVILVIGLYILYRPFKEPLKDLWGSIRGLFTRIRDRNSEVRHDTIRTIQYE